MHFTIGSYLDEDRKNGWVVSGYQGEDSHRLFDNKKQAIDFINKNK